MFKLFIQIFTSTIIFLLQAAAQHPDSLFIVDHYEKTERMVPMRDGVLLYTAIYLPKNKNEKYPILLTRTISACKPYGANNYYPIWRNQLMPFGRAHYILVMQEIRGTHKSQGKFELMKPVKTAGISNESTDAYDTVEWLINNVSPGNGAVGIYGSGYDSYNSYMAANCGHQSIKAAIIENPLMESNPWNMLHSNGAFKLASTIDLIDQYRTHSTNTTDAYNYFLSAGPLKYIASKNAWDTISFWKDMMQHSLYDDWWKDRMPATVSVEKLPPILIAGNMFDASNSNTIENFFNFIDNNNQAGNLHFAFGPFYSDDRINNANSSNAGLSFIQKKAGNYYQQQIAIPFFQHYLNNQPANLLSKANVFFTGSYKPQNFTQWPPADTEEQLIYLHAGGKLSFAHPKSLGYRDKPEAGIAYTEYNSDPNKPVPSYDPVNLNGFTEPVLLSDQRFASKRKDVISFQSSELNEAITVAGTVVADLMISVGNTDADFIVKLIDVLPDDVAVNGAGPDTIFRGQPQKNNYQMLVAANIMRGKYRNNLEEPEPFVPNKITRIKFDLPLVAHKFQKGHRIMVQIQSSWFPLFDRNPQIFTDIYKAEKSSFKKVSIRLFHTEGVTSKLVLPVLNNSDQ